MRIICGWSLTLVHESTLVAKRGLAAAVNVVAAFNTLNHDPACGACLPAVLLTYFKHGSIL
jgi:hypothetical protein